MSEYIDAAFDVGSGRISSGVHITTAKISVMVHPVEFVIYRNYATRADYEKFAKMMADQFGLHDVASVVMAIAPQEVPKDLIEGFNRGIVDRANAAEAAGAIRTMVEEAIDLGNRLREGRRTFGTVAQVAAALGIRVNTVYAMEKDPYGLSLNLVMRFAHLVGIVDSEVNLYWNQQIATRGHKRRPAGVVKAQEAAKARKGKR